MDPIIRVKHLQAGSLTALNTDLQQNSNEYGIDLSSNSLKERDGKRTAGCSSLQMNERLPRTRSAEYDTTRVSAQSKNSGSRRNAPSMHSANAQVNFESLHYRHDDQPTAYEQMLIDYLMFSNNNNQSTSNNIVNGAVTSAAMPHQELSDTTQTLPATKTMNSSYQVLSNSEEPNINNGYVAIKQITSNRDGTGNEKHTSSQFDPVSLANDPNAITCPP